MGKDAQTVMPIVISCIAVLLIAIVTVSFIVATVTLVWSRAKIKMELEHAKNRMNAEIYEEIDCNEMSIPVPRVNTDKNIAYAEVSK